MNMLTPDRASKVLNADLETGKVVSEWGFQKDGVDVDMRDVANETKAAQLDDRNTFLGIGQNRWAHASADSCPPFAGLMALVLRRSQGCLLRSAADDVLLLV